MKGWDRGRLARRRSDSHVGGRDARGPSPIATIVALGLLLSPAIAKDPTAKTCASTVAYHGAPLRAALADTALPDPAASIDGRLDPELAARLDRALDESLAATKAPGVTAALAIPGGGTWSSSRGLAPLAADAVFYWASAGKLFTAAVVHQLVDEGKLAYTDALSTWYPDFPNARAITVDQLLTHTSGTFSFQADVKLHEDQRYRAPEELIRVAAEHGSVACPGELWSYSNTGYVLLARIAEKIDGEPFDRIVRRRLVEPLGLGHTTALAPRQTIPGLAIGHKNGAPDTGFDPSLPFGAGCVVSTAADMVAFVRALLTGRATKPATVRGALARLYPMFDGRGLWYGRGVMVYDLADERGEPVVWIGHSGGNESSKAVAAYDATDRVFVAVAANADVPAEAIANRLTRVVREWRRERAATPPSSGR